MFDEFIVKNFKVGLLKHLCSFLIEKKQQNLLNRDTYINLIIEIISDSTKQLM